MNDAVSKFVNSCTEATGQHNTILHFGQRPFNNYYRGNRRPFRGNNSNHGIDRIMEEIMTTLISITLIVTM
mgnify:CR=1 FL=1